MRPIALFVVLPTIFACSDVNFVRLGPVKVPVDQQQGMPTNTSTFFDLSALDIHGDTVRMDRYKGHKILVVNTASECGFTPQYAQLEELYETYKDKGLVVIGFPSNDFGHQEPGSEAQIETFCRQNYGVTFPMMSKVVVKGDHKHPVYQWLTERQLNGRMDVDVKWNFQKFLIDEQGQLVTTVAHPVDPLDPVIVNWVEGTR